jgi:hypothetical protein
MSEIDGIAPFPLPLWVQEGRSAPTLHHQLLPPLRATVGKLRGSALNRYLDSEPKFSTELPGNVTAAHDSDDLPADLLFDHRPPRY